DHQLGVPPPHIFTPHHDRAIGFERVALRAHEALAKARGHLARIALGEITPRPARFPAACHCRARTSRRDRLLEGFDLRRGLAGDDLDTGLSKAGANALEGLVGCGTGNRPSFALYGDQAPRLPRRSGRGVAIKARRARIATGVDTHLPRARPHVLDRVGVRSNRRLAVALALAAIERALRRLQRDVAAKARRADDRSANLRAE